MYPMTQFSKDATHSSLAWPRPLSDYAEMDHVFVVPESMTGMSTEMAYKHSNFGPQEMLL